MRILLRINSKSKIINKLKIYSLKIKIYIIIDEIFNKL